jgi:hypothetical protein
MRVGSRVALHHAMRSDFILDEIDASSLRFLRSRPSLVETKPQRYPLTDGHDAGRAQRSGDMTDGAFHNDRGPATPAFPRGTDTVAPAERDGQGEPEPAGTG